MKAGSLRLTILGGGAMHSPRYAPAGLLVEHIHRVMIDVGASGRHSVGLDYNCGQCHSCLLRGLALELRPTQ